MLSRPLGVEWIHTVNHGCRNRQFSSEASRYVWRAYRHVELIYSVNVGALKQRTHLCFAVNKTKLENQVHIHVGEWLNISVPAVLSSRVSYRYAENIRITKLHIAFNLHLPWHRRFDVGLSPRRPGFSCSIICGIYGGWRGTGAGLSRNTEVIPVSYSSNAPYRFVMETNSLLGATATTKYPNSCWKRFSRALTIKITAFCPQSLCFVWFHSMGIVILTPNVIDQLVHVMETDRVHCKVTPEFLNVLCMWFRLQRLNLKTWLTIHSTFM